MREPSSEAREAERWKRGLEGGIVEGESWMRRWGLLGSESRDEEVKGGVGGVCRRLWM